jgi:hypothetical protein
MISAPMFVQQLKYHKHCFHCQTQTIEMVPVEHQMVAFCTQLLSKIGCQPQIQVSTIYQVQFNKKLDKKRKCEKCDSYHEMNLILNRVQYFIFQTDAAEYFTRMTPAVSSYRHGNAPWG